MKTTLYFVSFWTSSDCASQLSASELKGNVGSQTCLLEFALSVPLAESIINLLRFTTDFPFIPQIDGAAVTSGLWGSRAAWWPPPSCNLEGHRIVSVFGQNALELDAESLPALEEYTILI